MNREIYVRICHARSQELLEASLLAYRQFQSKFLPTHSLIVNKDVPPGESLVSTAEPPKGETGGYLLAALVKNAIPFL